MKKTILSTLGAAALLCFCQGQAQAQMLVINEVYPGGGSSSTTANPQAAYTRDFVELYNTSATPFSLAGYALQYSAAGATSDFTSTIVSFGTGSVIGGNDYLSIYTGAAGTVGATLTAGSGAGFVTYVAPTNSASLSATAGSVRLINLSTNVILDLVGYGTVTTATASGNLKSEGASATAPSIANSIDRTNFIDTNSNSADFTSMAPSPNAGTNSVVVVAMGVPEPSTYAMMALGILGMFAVLRARRRTA